MKQAQYSPAPYEHMVLIFFAASNRYLDSDGVEKRFLDGVKVEEVLDFERRMIKFFQENHADVLEKIRTEADLSDELTQDITNGLLAFKKFNDPIQVGQAK
jgi:F-type H+-transporting ATPase subunit alpha